jgi:hypothetical protein
VPDIIDLPVPAGHASPGTARREAGGGAGPPLSNYIICILYYLHVRRGKAVSTQRV